MRRACSVGIDDAELHVSWYGCYLTGQGGRSARLPFRRVSRGLGVCPTIVGLVLQDLTGYPQQLYLIFREQGQTH